MPKFSAESLPDLTGKVYLVTGGNAGIGRGTVAALAAHGARVYMGARSEQKAQATIQTILGTSPKADVRFLPMDLNKFSTVVAAAKKVLAEETRLHGLVNNAGIMGTPYSMTDDGFEAQFQTNYLSHWLLTYYLLPLLQSTALAEKQTPGAVRIVNVSSSGHALYTIEGGIRFADTALESQGGMTRYGQSKLANVLHARQLNKLYGPEREGEIWTAAVHPGIVQTQLLNNSTSLAPAFILRAATAFGGCLGLFADEAKGAVSSLWSVAGADFPRANSGSYVVPYAKIGQASDTALDAELAERLWTWTEKTFREKGLLE